MGQFCVSSLIDTGTEDIQNGGLVLFWQKELLENSMNYKNFTEYYLTCQVTTSYPKKKEDFIIFSEKIVSSALDKQPLPVIATPIEDTTATVSGADSHKNEFALDNNYQK